MKHFKSLSLATLASLMITACTSLGDGSQSYHLFTITSPSDGVCQLYADQTADTIYFTTTENWKATPSSDWITINAATQTGTVPSGYYEQFSLYFNTSVNTSDTLRIGTVVINLTNDDYKKTAGMYVYNYPVHQVSSASLENINNDMKHFDYLQVDSARQVSDVLKFTTYYPWTLTTSPAKIKSLPASTAITVTPATVSGPKGYNAITLNIDTTFAHVGDSVITTLYLQTDHGTAGKVTTPIKLVQAPQRKK